MLQHRSIHCVRRGPEKSIPRSRRDGRPAACGIDAAATLQPSSMRLPAVWILDDDDNLLVSHQGKHRIVTAGSLWMSARQSRQKQGRPSAHPSSVRRWQRRLAGDFADPGCVAIDLWSTRFNPREAAACRQRGEHLWHASRIHTRSCSCSVLTFRHPIGRMVLSTGREVVLFRTGAQDSKKKKKIQVHASPFEARQTQISCQDGRERPCLGSCRCRHADRGTFETLYCTYTTSCSDGDVVHAETAKHASQLSTGAPRTAGADGPGVRCKT